MTKKTTPKPATPVAAIDYNALADAIAERIVPARARGFQPQPPCACGDLWYDVVCVSQRIYRNGA